MASEYIKQSEKAVAANWAHTARKVQERLDKILKDVETLVGINQIFAGAGRSKYERGKADGKLAAYERIVELLKLHGAE